MYTLIMKHVLLSLSWYDPPLHEGVATYGAEHGWQLNSDPIRRMGHIRGTWSGDGIIVYPGRVADVSPLVRSGKYPVVAVQTRDSDRPFPTVSSDTDKVTSQGFEFFRRKGFQHFGCYGWGESKRLEAFRTLVTNQGLKCHSLTGKPGDLRTESDRIQNWLKTMPLPLAVYTNNDDQGALFINLAKERGFRIPSDVAVLGTDNSRLACMAAQIPLSSIDTNLFQVGYRAAELLDRLMDGEKLQRIGVSVDPKGIIERASTDTIGATSPHVRRAFAIMESDYDKGICVGDIVADVGISSTGLEKAFKRELGYTPVVALRNVRMKVAAQLLVTTDEKVRSIASKVGMNNPEYFHAAFKRHYGVTPRRYRLNAKGI